ncbi:hypothetical protein KQI63_02930 [bacterium]|nr:hypothetical protein [bacterium]
MVRKLESFAAVAILTAMLLFTVGCGSASDANRLPFGTIDTVEMDHILDPETHILTSKVSLSWTDSPSDTFFFLLNRHLLIEDFDVEGGTAAELLQLGEGDLIGPRLLSHTVDSLHTDDYGHLALLALPISGRSDTVKISMSYAGEIYDDIEVPEFSRWAIADETTGLIGEKGAFLTPMTGYYPSTPGKAPLSIFTTTIHYPENWEALVEGNILNKGDGTITFESGQRIDGSYLVAGPYDLNTVDADGIEIAMYSYPQSADLVDKYLQFSTRYISMYQEMLGPYAFDRFSVVENWFPTGYGMPSFTLLGTDVLRLPFIVYTSLGHEICHNWWGNGVLVDYETGNWCEGLTTYCADYHYKVQRGPDEAKQYRLDVLRDYSDYVIRGDEQDFPVRDFTSRTTAGTRTIGYGKVMMIFHMMEERIGEEAFWTSLRDIYNEKMFQRADWTDFMDMFAKQSGERFDWYERQWVDRAGAPQLVIENPMKSMRDGGQTAMIEFDLRQTQESDPFVLDVPIRVHFASDSVAEHVLRDVRGKMYHARVEVEGQPTRVEVDPDFHLFRVLDIREAPATLSGFFADETPVAVVPSGSNGAMYRAFTEQFLSRTGVEYVDEADFDPSAHEGHAIIRFGMTTQIANAKVDMESNGVDFSGGNSAIVAAHRNSETPDLVHLDVYGVSAEALAPIARKLPHYGKYSYLAFTAGQNIGKGQWTVTNSPLAIDLP